MINCFINKDSIFNIILYKWELRDFLQKYDSGRKHFFANCNIFYVRVFCYYFYNHQNIWRVLTFLTRKFIRLPQQRTRNIIFRFRINFFRSWHCRLQILEDLFIQNVENEITSKIDIFKTNKKKTQQSLNKFNYSLR